jgi:hypothetical protein
MVNYRQLAIGSGREEGNSDLYGLSRDSELKYELDSA